MESSLREWAWQRLCGERHIRVARHVSQGCTRQGRGAGPTLEHTGMSQSPRLTKAPKEDGTAQAGPPSNKQRKEDRVACGQS